MPTILFFRRPASPPSTPSCSKQAKLKVVYTPYIHGVGGFATVPVLQRAGVEVVEEPAQKGFDPALPDGESTESPENAEALTLAVRTRGVRRRSTSSKAPIPDCDPHGAGAVGRQRRRAR
jgi:hypothetical protein